MPGPNPESYRGSDYGSASAEAISSRDRNVRWYQKEIREDQVHDSTREILEKYSGIPPDDVVPHILKIRDRAFDIFPYPCIGQFRFLDLSIGRSQQYAEVLERVKKGDQFLDVGCCFGQDIRRLVFDGAPVENVHGSDLLQAFLELGYDLFLDHDKLPRSTFFAADIFAPTSPLDELAGNVDMIHAASFFHLFGYEDSQTVAKKFVAILRKKPGSMVLGRQMGNKNPGEFEHKAGKGSMYRHNPESFKKWWDEVGEATGTKWNVFCEEDKTRTWNQHTGDGSPADDPGRMPLRYCVTLL